MAPSCPLSTNCRRRENRQIFQNVVIVVRERVNVLWERVNFLTIDGMSAVAYGTPGDGER
jgi:hypothetical protein